MRAHARSGSSRGMWEGGRHHDARGTGRALPPPHEDAKIGVFFPSRNAMTSNDDLLLADGDRGRAADKPSVAR